MEKVYCNQNIKGMIVPAIIHNMQYYYIDIPIYEDGTLDCWGRISMSQLPEKVGRWLVTEVPMGERLSIFGLGVYLIIDAKWEYYPTAYIQHIRDCVKSMNAEMTGTRESLFRMKDGESSHVLYKMPNGWMITNVMAYKDESLSIDAIPDQYFTMDEIRNMFLSGQLSSETKGIVTLLMPGLGSIAGEAIYSVKSEEKLKEIENMLLEASGKPGLLDQCRAVYEEYLQCPSDECRERLRVAYEAVPEHERMYLGDMDSRDSDYQSILYSNDSSKA